MEERFRLGEEETFEVGEPIPIDISNSDDVTKPDFIEPISIIVTVTLAWICKRLVDDWLKNKEKGVQIDLRQMPPIVSRIAGTPRGFLIVIDKNSNAKVHKAEYETAEELLPTIQALLH